MFSVNSANRTDYYKYLARLNFECADAADRRLGFLPGYELAAPPPVMTLCAHSIELSLKAFLLEHGLSEKEVRAFNHGLVKMWDRCKQIAPHGLPNINEKTLAIIGDLLMSGRLRYGDESELGRVPVYGPLSDLCRQLLETCGAPTIAQIAAAGRSN